MGRCILILGGARSGKSRLALDIANKTGEKVLFVATAEALDDEMRQRIEKHKRERPPGWRTVEAPTEVGRRITEALADADVVIVDCLTLLMSNILVRCCRTDDPNDVDLSLAESRLGVEVAEMERCIDQGKATFIVVSNEVGLGLVPDNAQGRIYRDCLGRANQMLAARADEVYLMIAGIPLRLPKATNWPL